MKRWTEYLQDKSNHSKKSNMNMNSYQESGVFLDSRKQARFSEDCSIMSSDFDEPPRKKRVRAKLDHLSSDEKLDRRKMKNRIAAQTARDRKREKIEKLEERVRSQQDEIEFLKSQLKMVANSTTTNNRSMSAGTPMSINMTSADSGTSEISSDSIPKTTASICMADSSDMNFLIVPGKSQHINNSNNTTTTTNLDNCANFASPHSPGSSTSGAYSASPIPECLDTHIESVVGETDVTKLMDDIIQLDRSLHGDSSTDASFGSAASISVPQQQDKDTAYQSPLVENSAGWTSIQLMLLLMISKVHRLFSMRVNCCATIHSGPNRSSIDNDEIGPCNNLYDYILQTKCIDFRRAAEAIISNKNNVRQQKLIALEFMYIYLYNVELFRTRLHCN